MRLALIALIGVAAMLALAIAIHHALFPRLTELLRRKK